MNIEGSEFLTAYILAPLAVALRRQPVSTSRKLIEAGLSALRLRGADLVSGLGDDRYYGKYVTHECGDSRIGLVPARSRAYAHVAPTADPSRYRSGECYEDA